MNARIYNSEQKIALCAGAIKDRGCAKVVNLKTEYYCYSLIDYPPLINETYISDFVESLNTSNFGYFRQISDTIKSAFKADSAKLATILKNDSLINDLLVNKHNNDSLIDTLGQYVDNVNLFDENKGIVSQISMLSKNNGDFRVLQDSLIIEKANSALEINSGLSSDKIFEQNYISFYRIYLNWISHHNYSFTTGEIDTLYNIAIQCPLSGGKAVAIAQTMYRLVNDTLTFSSDTSCSGSSSRMSKGGNSSHNSYIYPNPTNNAATLQYSLPCSENGWIIICNTLGGEILKIDLPSKGTNKKFGCEDFGQGLYYYKIIQNGDLISYGKFSVIK